MESTTVATDENNDDKSKYSDNDNIDQYSIQKVSSSIDESILDESHEVPHKMPYEEIETRSSGNIAFSVYSSYISAGGNIFKISFLVFVCLLTQVLATSGDYWITFWYYKNAILVVIFITVYKCFLGLN